MSQEVNQFLYALMLLLADAIDEDEQEAEEVKPAPHKWAKEKAAYESGQTVLYRARPDVNPYDKWDEVPPDVNPWDDKNLEFRIAHPWRKEIIAWANGKTIEYRFKPAIRKDNWDVVEDGVTPEWDSDEFEFRIQPNKPDPVKLRYRVGIVDEGDRTAPYPVMVADENGQSAWERYAVGGIKVTWLHDWRTCAYERSA